MACVCVLDIIHVISTVKCVFAEVLMLMINAFNVHMDIYLCTYECVYAAVWLFTCGLYRSPTS